ncbi:hypothetical protein NE237_012528 [Protea cynaroides]|uniref:Uncharacterized protein n=1 Tax=Protea cynaroides TaxID=273540 RepID=A0A9Q0JYX3_9MAGN|nr:hypothetical protein NE237_012528 [Protea cynaroides]
MIWCGEVGWLSITDKGAVTGRYMESDCSGEITIGGGLTTSSIAQVVQGSSKRWQKPPLLERKGRFANADDGKQVAKPGRLNQVLPTGKRTSELSFVADLRPSSILLKFTVGFEPLWLVSEVMNMQQTMILQHAILFELPSHVDTKPHEEVRTQLLVGQVVRRPQCVNKDHGPHNDAGKVELISCIDTIGDVRLENAHLVSMPSLGRQDVVLHDSAIDPRVGSKVFLSPLSIHFVSPLIFRLQEMVKDLILLH